MENLIGIIACIPTTVLMIWGTIKLFDLDQDTSFNFCDPGEVFGAIAVILLFAAVWWTFPGAWARGLLMDPTLIVGGLIGGALLCISGSIESEDAYKRRTGRKR